MSMESPKIEMDSTTYSIIKGIRSIIIGEMDGLVYPLDNKDSKTYIQISPYIKFLPIVVCIEFLGACYDELPFDTSRMKKKKIVETRFNIAIKKLFPNSYAPFTKANNKFYLYENLRCAMVHQLRPRNGIMFTTRRESIKDTTKHLQEIPQGFLILILEDFYDDLKAGAEKIISKFETGKLTNRKGEQAFINVYTPNIN